VKLSILAAIITSSCCPGEVWPKVDFYTDRGVGVELNGLGDSAMPKAEADHMDDWLYGWAPAFNPRYSPACLSVMFHTARVYMVSGAFRCVLVDAQGNGSWGLCDGQEVKGELTVARSYDPRRTAYVHELFHWTQEVCGSPCASDYKHKEIEAWKIIETYPWR
jgi:hypothetical protein